MFRSVLQITQKASLFIAIVALAVLYCGFKPPTDEQQMLTWGNKFLNGAYDPSAEAGLEKWDITLTNDSFLRLNKTFKDGKKEYFSFQLRLFNDMDYLGTTNNGMLQLKANGNDIIVQTYDDPGGDIDTMAMQLDLPLKNIETQQLDSLQMALNYFKNKDL